jgi:hypothetical protein
VAENGVLLTQLNKQAGIWSQSTAAAMTHQDGDHLELDTPARSNQQHPNN